MTFQSMASEAGVTNQSCPSGFGNLVSCDLEWRKETSSYSKTNGNPLELDGDKLERTKELAPPIHKTTQWKKAGIPEEAYRYDGRYLVPFSKVSYGLNVQPRQKSNEVEQVNQLIEDYEVYGYREDKPVPIATNVSDEVDTDPYRVKALSSFHRRSACGNLKPEQKCYYYDLYSFSSPYWEAVAKSVTNHHGAPQLTQKWTDYKSEVVAACDSGIIQKNEQEISKFVDRIAADKPSDIRKRIKAHSFREAGIYPSFTTFNSKGSGVGTIQYFVKHNLGLPPMGFEGRTDEEIQKQGYIHYSASCGDVLRGWSGGIKQAMIHNIPVWLFGYSTDRVDDLVAFREKFIEVFVGYKEKQLMWCYRQARSWVPDDALEEYDALTVDKIVEMVDQDRFNIKLGGFYAQHTSRNANDGGRPTEVGLVDVYGKTLNFDPLKSKCLTLSQP